MATIDPFTKGGGTSSGSSGAIPSNVATPITGPRDQLGNLRPSKGPYGGRTSPPWTGGITRPQQTTVDYGRAGGSISDEGAE